MTIKDGLLADFDHEMGTTRRLLERLPDDRLGWRPHPRSMTLRGLPTHLSTIPSWGGRILNDASFDLVGAPPPAAEKASRADILSPLDAGRREARPALDKTHGEHQSPWTQIRGGRQGLPVPPA